MPVRTALIVDDEISVRRYVKFVLEGEEMATIEADNGVDALRLLVERDGRIDIIVSDVRMPQGDGLTFARAAQRLYPKTPILLISGFVDGLRPERPVEFEFLEKPFRAGMLVARVRKLLPQSHAS